MGHSGIAFAFVALVTFQVGSGHITRLSVGPYFQTGYLDGSLHSPFPGCPSSPKYLLFPAKTSSLSASLSSHCPLSGKSLSTCSTLHRASPSPACFDPFCAGRLPSAPRLSPPAPCPRTTYSTCGPIGGACYTDDCW